MYPGFSNFSVLMVHLDWKISCAVCFHHWSFPAPPSESPEKRSVAILWGGWDNEVFVLNGLWQETGKTWERAAYLLRCYSRLETTKPPALWLRQLINIRKKNISWERSWNRSEAKLDQIYWSVNREKSVRGKMHRGVANLLGPILGVSKELF